MFAVDSIESRENEDMTDTIPDIALLALAVGSNGEGTFS